MINVEAHEDYLRLNIKGHADAERNGEGHDLVCAAASMLLYTLAEAWAEDGEVRLQDLPGDAQIRVIPDDGHALRALSQMRTILHGYTVLSRRYPDHVRVTVD